MKLWLLVVVLLQLRSLIALSVVRRGNGTESDVDRISSKPSDQLVMAESIPDDYETQITWKSNGKRLDKMPFMVDIVLAMASLAVKDDFNSGFPTGNIGTIATIFKLVSSKLDDSPGFQIKTVMWSLRQVFSFMHQERTYAELNFMSKMHSDAPFLGFGQVSLRETPVSFDVNTTDNGGLVDSKTYDNQTLSMQLQATQTDVTALSRRAAVKRAIQPNVYVSDFRRSSNVRLDDYGIYISMASLIIQETSNAAEKSGGLDSVVQGMVAVQSADTGVSVAIGSSSMRSTNLTRRKAILAITDLASKMSKFTGVNKFKPVDFLVREEGGAIIGRGVVVRGLPPVGAQSLLLYNNMTDT